MKKLNSKKIFNCGLLDRKVRMQIIGQYCLLFFLLLIITACSTIRIEPRKYYILEYKNAKESEDLFRRIPHPFSARVNDAEISGTYNRRQIVIRLSENQIVYDIDNLWADRLPIAIANLVHERIGKYNFFNRLVRDFQQRARYEIITYVNALEFIDNGNTFGTRLNVEFQLRRTSDNLMVFQHKADRNRLMPSKDIEYFVQTVNDLLMEETDMFLRSLNFNIDNIEQGVEFNGRNFFTSQEFLADSLNANYRLILAEEEFVLIKGRLFIPVKTDSDHEPLFSVEDEDNNYVGSYEMGTEVYLDAGVYFVYIGNGTISQQVVEKIEILPRYKTVLNPDVGWLTIDVIDENRNQIDHRYELFDLSSAESYGFGYGVKEGVGQQLDTWVIKPGFYKIVLNGEPFNTFRDFATVEVKKGELVQFTIVIDEETKHLMGAGRSFFDEYGRQSRRLKMSVMNHLNANLNSKNETEKNKNSTTITVIEQLDSKMVYDSNPYHYTLKNLIEIGITKETESDLKISNDKFDLKNTFIYYFLQNIGTYARADLNSHMFPTYIYTQETKTYLRIDKTGLDSVYVNTDKFRVRNAYYPLILKQGAGINYRVLNKNRSSLNFRVGLGFRQDINNRVYSAEKKSGTSEEDDIEKSRAVEVYRELDSIYQEGIEFSINGNFQILRNLNYSMIGDILQPFNKDMTDTYEMENIFNLRMFKYISLDYRLNLSYNKNVREYLYLDHSLYLKFTYIFLR